MPMTDAQRRANQKWDAANNTVVSLKTRKDKASAFKEACYDAGTTPNAVLNAAMQAFMEAHGGWEKWLRKPDAEAEPTG